MGNFERAVRQMLDDEQVCPHCGARDLPAPAKRTLEHEQDGSLTCAQCGTNFAPKEK